MPESKCSMGSFNFYGLFQNPWVNPDNIFATFNDCLFHWNKVSYKKCETWISLTILGKTSGDMTVTVPSTPVEATILPFEVMIGHNSRTDCARESVKTSTDSENSNRSDEFEKVNFAFENVKKNANFYFLVAVFRQYSKKLKKFLSRLPASFFETFLWLGLRLKIPFDQKFQPKWVITVLGEIFGWKCG